MKVFSSVRRPASSTLRARFVFASAVMVIGPVVITSSSPGACAWPSCALDRLAKPMTINPAATTARRQSDDLFMLLFWVGMVAGIDGGRLLQEILFQKWAAGRGGLEIDQRLKIICSRRQE